MPSVVASPDTSTDEDQGNASGAGISASSAGQQGDGNSVPSFANVAPTGFPDGAGRAGTVDEQQQRQRSSSQSPPRPPYSPITPVQTFASLVQQQQLGGNSSQPPTVAPPPPPRSGNTAQTATTTITPRGTLPAAPASAPPAPVTFIDEPSPLPFSETDNTDAIALRAALSVLQLQKQQSERDIRGLERTKRAALEDPEGFVRELRAGRLGPPAAGDGMLNLTVGEGASDEEDGEMDVDPLAAAAAGAPRLAGEWAGHGETEGGGESGRNKFGHLRPAQNVARMPPVNWAKYHVVGDALDRLHEEQRRMPTAGEPRGAPVGVGRQLQQQQTEHAVLAPYSPFVDRVDASANTSASATSKAKGGSASAGGVGKKG